jgi:hypothetical protein
MDPRRVLLVKAVSSHPERERILELQQETDEYGERRWSLCRQVEDDGWFVVWLRPWPLDRFDERAPIRIGAWPLDVETDALADAQAVIDEHDDSQR